VWLLYYELNIFFFFFFFYSHICCSPNVTVTTGLRRHSLSLLQGASGYRTAMAESLAAMLGQQSWAVQAGSLSYEGLTRVMTATWGSGLWLLFRDVTAMSTGMLSALAQHVRYLRINNVTHSVCYSYYFSSDLPCLAFPLITSFIFFSIQARAIHAGLMAVLADPKSASVSSSIGSGSSGGSVVQAARLWSPSKDGLLCGPVLLAASSTGVGAKPLPRALRYVVCVCVCVCGWMKACKHSGVYSIIQFDLFI
jgi:hypothetical protein